MAELLKPLGLAALIALAGPALAQDAAATDEAPAAEETAPDVELEMGQPADGPAQPQIEEYVDEVFGDWERTCLRITDFDGPPPCHLAQLLYEEGNENPIGKISIGKLPESVQAEAASTIYVPLGVHLPQQLVFSVDSNAAKRYPYTGCQPIGCFSQFGLTGAEVNALKAGKSGKIAIAPLTAPDQKIEVQISLAGFTDGWNSLTIPEEPAQPAAE